MSKDTPTRPKRQREKFKSTKPYSLERLEKALRVFGKAKYRLRRQSLPCTNIGNYLRSTTYNLRSRKSSGVDAMDVVEIHDNDDNDGNYQPGKEPARKKKKTQAQSSGGPPKHIVKFSFSSINGKILLHRLAHASAFADYNDEDDQPGSVCLEDKNSDSNRAEMSEAIERSIRTAFAHPIDCELGNTCGMPCEFCEDFTFGMFGLGLKDVEVIDHGTFFEEIEGGHREDGHQRTRMCNICALERLRILNCNDHKISQIANSDPRRFDYQKAFDSLKKSNNRKGKEAQITPWCTFCINPAFFRCATVQLVNIFAEDLDPSNPEAEGCGLLLCPNCKILMEKHHKNIAHVIKVIPVSEGVRADADFLVPRSNLSRYFNE